MTTYSSAIAQLDFTKIKSLEQQLDDVMELIDTSAVKRKLKEVEESYRVNPSEMHKVRLGIIYHETALNLGFFSKTEYTGYAQKSYSLLSELFNAAGTTPALMPYIASYRASVLSLVGAETRKLKLLADAFTLFGDAVEKYSALSYCPEFMRGSVSENLPWFFFSKRKYAKRDFMSIVAKNDRNPEYANWKIMSFTYWAWAKQHQSKKYRKQAVVYLNKAIALDTNYQAGRKKAEELRNELTK